MSEEALIKSERNGGPEPDSEAGLFNRNIDFHVAREPFSGFSNGRRKTLNGLSNGSSNGFKLLTLNPNSGVHQASGSEKKSERPEYLDSGMDPELGLETTFRKIGAGLRNLGNTCFLNSVLQCLTYTEPLAAYLQSGKHQNSCRTTGFCALCAIQKHVSRALQATGRILEPKDLVSNLRCISRSFRNSRQEDAHEYMVNLLESMHKCCLPSGVPIESPSAYEKSLVHKIFGGRLRSQVKCMQCSFCSNKFDPFLDLSLEILKADSLQKALRHFTAKEQLDGGAKQYQCQQCKQKVKALKQLTIYKAPLVLTVHLKRFGHIHGQKIDNKIAFGPTLDLKPFVSGTHEGDLNYTLYGVLVHAGWSTHSGHYYCFVRTSSGMWYSLDDNQVVQVNERKVLEQKAYMLFYVRDRRSFCRKKPIDILQKENIIMNAFRKSYSKVSRDSNDKAHNGSTEKNTDASVTATSSVSSSTVRDEKFATAPMECPLEKVVLPDGSVKRDLNHDSERDSRSEFLPGIASEHPGKDLYALNTNNFGYQADCECCKGLETLCNGAAASNINCNDSVSVIRGQNPSVVVASPNCSVPKNSHQEKDTGDFVAMPSLSSEDRTKESSSEPVDQPLKREALCTSSGDVLKMDDTNYEMCEGEAISSVGTDKEALNQVNGAESSNRNSTLDNLVGVCQKNDDATTEETHESKVIAKTKQPQLKVKKKLFKCRVATMSFNSSKIFGVALSVGKKEQRRRKQRSGRKLSHSLKHPSCGSFKKKIKKVKCRSGDKDLKMSRKSLGCDGIISSDVISNDFKERSVLSGMTLAANNQQGPGQSGEVMMESRLKSAMSMLTRGLEEATVARWNGIDVSMSESSEIRAAKIAQVGNIGDEWGEEYDKGKRKKLRKPMSTFGGPNSFQEISSKNSERKRTKMQRPSSDNPPFRI